MCLAFAGRAVQRPADTMKLDAVSRQVLSKTKNQNFSIMIAYPPLEGKGTPLLGQNRQFQWFHHPTFIYPMVPSAAATLLRDRGFKLEYCDAIAKQWSEKTFMEHFRQTKPDLIAIETKTPTIKSYWNLIGQMKKESPSTNIVLMGDHVTAFPQESLERSQVDYVLEGGHYDYLLSNLADHLAEGMPLGPGIWYRDTETGSKYRSLGPPVHTVNLDCLPFIDRDLTDWSRYGEKWYRRNPNTMTMVGRDCAYGKCTFCSWTTTHPKYSSRKYESLLDEIGILIERYGMREIFDDTGTFPTGGWMERFCNGMIDRGYHKKVLLDCNMRFDWLRQANTDLMKQAGFRLMKLGLESASQETVDRLDKGTNTEDIYESLKKAKASGLEVHLTIMFGYPWETRQDANATLEMARDLFETGLADTLQGTIVIPYPGTPLYKESIKNNWLTVDPEDYDKFDMSRPIFKTPGMSHKEVTQYVNSLYRTFLRPRYLWQQIKKVRTPEDAAYLASGIRPLWGHLRDFMKIK